MKQLKISLFILMCGVGVLVALAYFPLTSETGQRIQAKVISNTLTQSLDGHRRYLTVQTKIMTYFGSLLLLPQTALLILWSRLIH